MSDEITTTILRQIRDDTLMRDAVTRAIMLSRVINNKIEPAIADLVKRVARVEKKVG